MVLIYIFFFSITDDFRNWHIKVIVTNRPSSQMLEHGEFILGAFPLQTRNDEVIIILLFSWLPILGDLSI